MSVEAAIRHIPASFEQIAAKIAGVPVKQHRVVSMFTGCGGMDLGFLGGFGHGGKFYDKLPFRVVWANDLNKAAAKTYKENLKHKIQVGDIADVFETMPKTADVLIGGFPCQDVSINGIKQGADGERTILYRQMIKAIERTEPRIFVAENVKGLLQSHGRELLDQMLGEFQATGYRVSHRLYLAADYEVPQRRERLFLVGVKGRKDFEHPEAVSATHKTAKEAIGDLEEKPEDKDFSHVWSRAAKSPEQGDRRLCADKPATTIRAEHHGNVQWHYSLDRRISLRETARLQSFPDGFQFKVGDAGNGAHDRECCATGARVAYR